MKSFYSVIVPNGWLPNGAYSVAAHCGHAHRTLKAAERCQDKLIRLYCHRPEERNAKWASSTIALADRYGRPLRPPCEEDRHEA
jgi:hypothetical protein